MTSATDNRTTELREKLTERVIKWTESRYSGARHAEHTKWMTANGSYVKYTEYDDGQTVMTIEALNVTPEQAIAATLGNEYHGYEQAAIEAWKSIKAWNQRHVETCRITASATDGLCTDRPRQYFELSCGHSFTIDGLERPIACAVCGKKVTP